MSPVANFKPSEINRHSPRLQGDFRQEAPEVTEMEGIKDFIKRIVAEVVGERIEEIRNTRGKIHLLHLTAMPLPKYYPHVLPHQLENRDLISRGIFVPDTWIFTEAKFPYVSLSKIFEMGQIDEGNLHSVVKVVRKRFIYLNDLEGKEDDLGVDLKFEDLIILEERDVLESDPLTDTTYDLDAVYVHFSPQEKEGFSKFLRTGKKS